MEKDEIRQRCRKVYVHVTNNRIFSYGTGEYDFVNVFRDKQRAVESARAIQSTCYEWQKNEPKKNTKVVGFYLVPINRIDT